MSCSAPPAKKLKQSSPINELADTDLSEIFERLPLLERLMVSEVCRRWHSISRKAWLDIKAIDLSLIPGKHIGAIVNLSPNLQSVLAENKDFGCAELRCLAKVPNLSSAKFYGCTFEPGFLIPGNFGVANVFDAVFSRNLGSAPWQEFVLHNAAVNRLGSQLSFPNWLFNSTNLPASLTRLQLSGLRMDCFFRLLLDGLERLGNLECFILHVSPESRELTIDPISFAYIASRITFFEALSRLRKLKELCVGPVPCFGEQHGVRQVVSSLPQLEVLFLNDVNGDDIAEDLQQLIVTNSVLRILALSGAFKTESPIELKARKRFPNGFGSNPLPLLHVFVGKEASQNIRFAPIRVECCNHSSDKSANARTPAAKRHCADFSRRLGGRKDSRNCKIRRKRLELRIGHVTR